MKLGTFQKSTNKTPFDSAPHCGMVTSYWNRFFQPVAAAFNFPMGKPPGRLWLRLPATWLWGRRTSLRLEIGRQYSDIGAYYNNGRQRPSAPISDIEKISTMSRLVMKWKECPKNIFLWLLFPCLDKQAQKRWHSIMGLITNTLAVMLKWKRFLSKFLKIYTK